MVEMIGFTPVGTYHSKPIIHPTYRQMLQAQVDTSEASID
jgi:hypothetical protein